MEERPQTVMDLKGIGPFMASQLLSSVDEDFIMYHEDLLEGMKELIPEMRRRSIFKCQKELRMRKSI